MLFFAVSRKMRGATMRSFVLLLLAVSTAVQAQSVPGIQVTALPGMPFTGESTIIWTNQVSGKSVTTQLVEKVGRDSQGRLHRETHRFSVSPVDPQSTLTHITVSDPITATRTDCDTSTHLCLITAFQAPRPGATTSNPNLGVPSPSPVNNGKYVVTSESLGTRSIGDLPTIGMRRTISLALGAVATDQAGTSAVESWFSSDLRMNLSETRSYPNAELQVLNLKVLARADPDPSFFTIPAGYTVRDDRVPVDPVSGVGVSTLSGLPFSGKDNIVWTHTTADGKIVTTQTEGKIARDGQGRVYQERFFIAGSVEPQSTIAFTTVLDPVAGSQTDCNLATRHCRIANLRLTAVAVGKSGEGTTPIDPLGTKVVDGLTLTGQRFTTTSVASTGDKEAGTSTYESWYSLDLKNTVSLLRKLPHGEVQDLHLVITSRTEPEPSTFVIPDGFSVQDDRRPNVGAPNSPLSNTSMGIGSGTGTNPGVRRVGGAVSAPVLVHSVNPAYSEEARAARFGGTVTVNFRVDEQGNTTHVRVLRGVGMGLDEKAVEAVKQYKFKPAMEDGKPVEVELNAEVKFQIFR
jgi:TonB family protein